MVPSKFYTKLVEAKQLYPQMTFRLYGDCNQCKPVEEKWYDYMSNPLIMYLVNFNMKQLDYIVYSL